MTEQAIWRIALNDSTHPLNKAAWEIFRPKDISKKAADRLKPQQEDIVPFIYAILDEKSLEEETALGSGYAPSNAARLLGFWQIIDALPRLLSYYTDEYDMTELQDSAGFAIEKMPPEAIPTVIEFAKENPNRIVTAAIFVGQIGKNEERAFEFIKEAFEKNHTDEYDIITLAEMLATCDVDKAEVYLREQTRSGRFKKYHQDFLEIVESERNFRKQFPNE